jgi:hypothetical protein
MRSTKLLRILLLGVFLTILALAFSACGGGRRPTSAPVSGLTPPSVVSINDAVAELDAMSVPAGVDPAVFSELKAAFRSALVARGKDKVVCTPPTGTANVVPDLALSDNLDGTMNLSWHYYCVGDYNQDGIVGVSDITPLAMHYGETHEEGELNNFAAVVDGSGDLTVNIADVTPIAMNYGVQFAGYLIETSDTQGGAYTEAANLPMSFGQGEDAGRISFLYTFTPTPEAWYRVTPYDNNDALGVSSIEVQAPPPGETFPVASILADSVLGFSPLTVHFSSGSSYDPDGGSITKYEWDPDGDGDWDVDGGTNPLYQFEYPDAGTFHPMVRVTDDEGLQDTATTTITVVQIPDYDEVEPNNDIAAANILPAMPVTSFFGSLGENLPGYLGYDGGLQDWFSFDSSPGETVTIFCSFNSSLHVSFQLRDNEGDLLAQDLDSDNPQVLTYVFQPEDVAPYFMGLIGTGYSDYSLSVVSGAAPVADIVVFPTSGMSPLDVMLDAGASTDDGTITTYEWDFEGDGIYDENTGNTPITNHTYDTQGTYTPTVRITDNDTLTDTAQGTLDVWSSTYGEVENNDSIPSATPLPAFPFSSFTGSQGSNPPGYPGYDGDSDDYFSFTAEEGQAYSFKLDYSGATMQAGMNFYDSTGTLIMASGTYPGAEVSHTFVAGEAGVAIIEVVAVSGYGDYALKGINGSPPQADLTADPRNGDVPLSPNFDASGSVGSIVKYEFDFLGDGTFVDNLNDPTISFTYDTPGVYSAAVRVTDSNGFSDEATFTITAGSIGYDEIEDNDTQPAANQLPLLPVVAFKGSIGDNPPLYTGYDGDLVDWLLFLGPVIGNTATVDVTYSPTLNASVGLYDSEGDLLSSYSGGSPAVISYTFTPGDISPWYVRIDSVTGYGDYSVSVELGAPPTAVLLASPPSGSSPLLVSFDATNSWDLDGTIQSWDYDWDGDGNYELTGGTELEAHEYDADGQYSPTLKVTDNNGLTDTDTRWIFVGAVPYNEREQNDTELEANPLPLFPFSLFEGSAGSANAYPGYDGDSLDIFSFSAAEGNVLDFTLIFDFNSADLDLSLYDSDGDYLGGSYNLGDNEFFNYTVLPGDTPPFFLWVQAESGGADYQLDGTLS